MQRALFAITATLLLIFTSQFASARDSWTVRKELPRGAEIDIQTMYNIKSCVGQEVPPQPEFKKQPKLGTVEFWTGEAVPHQCPSTKINARFAKYKAGNTAGKDRSVIHWVSTEGSRMKFRVTYIIKVK